MFVHIRVVCFSEVAGSAITPVLGPVHLGSPGGVVRPADEDREGWRVGGGFHRHHCCSGRPARATANEVGGTFPVGYTVNPLYSESPYSKDLCIVKLLEIPGYRF